MDMAVAFDLPLAASCAWSRQSSPQQGFLRTSSPGSPSWRGYPHRGCGTRRTDAGPLEHKCLWISNTSAVSKQLSWYLPPEICHPLFVHRLFPPNTIASQDLCQLGLLCEQIISSCGRLPYHTGRPGHQHPDLISYPITLSWHWACQSLPYPNNTKRLTKKQQVYIFKSLVWFVPGVNPWGVNPMVSQTGCSTHSAIPSHHIYTLDNRVRISLAYKSTT